MVSEYEKQARIAAQVVAERTGYVVTVVPNAMYRHIEFYLKGQESPFFTISYEFMDDIPTGSLERVLDKALSEVIAELKKYRTDIR